MARFPTFKRGARIDPGYVIVLMLVAFVALAPARITLPMEINLFSYQVSPVALALPILATLFYILRPYRAPLWVPVFYALSLMVIIVTLIYHNHPERQLGAGAAIMTPISAILLAASLGPEKARHIVKWALTLGLVSLLMGICMLAISLLYTHELIGWAQYEQRLRTPFGSPIATGAILLFLSIMIAQKCINKLTPVRAILLAIVAVAIALTGSRAVFFASVIGLLILLGILVMRRMAVPLNLPKLLLLLGCAGIAAVWLAPTGERLIQGFGAGGGDMRRIESIQIAVELWQKQPIIGHGGGLIYPISHPDIKVGEGDQHKITLNGKTSLIEPHNLYVLLLVEYGLFGVIIFTFPLLVSAMILIRSDAFDCRSGGVALLAFSVFQLFGSHWYTNQSVAIWIGVLLGALLALNQANKPIVQKSDKGFA